MSVTLRVKKVMKVPVRGLQRVLPEKAFDAFYDFTFPKYKAVVRGSYLLGGLLVHSWRDADRWRMVRRLHRVMPRSLVGIGGLEATYALARRMNRDRVPGDFVELGVARGGCAALLGGAIFDGEDPGAAGRRLWLFDSYEGLPDPTSEDFREGASGTGDHVRPLPKGSCLGTLEDVQELLLDQEGFPAERIRFVKGWFQDTVPATRDQIDRIAVLRIDGDWYESTKVCLEGLYDKVSPGGAVIVDDYASCYGCERAVHEFLDARGLRVDIRLDGRGGCWFLKPAGAPARAVRAGAPA
jgi:O-methyltransferase